MIEKNERSYHLPVRAGQHAPHDKAAEISLVRPDHLHDLHDLPAVNTLIKRFAIACAASVTLPIESVVPIERARCSKIVFSAINIKSGCSLCRFKSIEAHGCC
jgi:hypothetical protein